MKRYIKSSSDGSGRKYEEIENNVFNGDLPCCEGGANFDSGTENNYEDQWADINVLISLIYEDMNHHRDFLDRFLKEYDYGYEDYDDFLDNYLDRLFNSGKSPHFLLSELEEYCRDYHIL